MTVHRSLPLARQVLLALFAVVALTLGGASPSWAHTALSATTPADGAELAVAPSEVVLQFTDEVIELGALVSVTGPPGAVDVGPLTVSGSTVTAGLPASMPGGSYSVDWRVSASDGHPISGTFSFSVEEGAPSRSEGADPPVSATDPAPAAADAATPAAVEEPGETSEETPGGDEGPSWPVWLFVGSAVVLVLLLAAFAFMRSQRRR